MIAGIVLAAGSARRMGCSKQLLPLGGRTMVWQVANAACHSNLDQVILVTGACKDQVACAVKDLGLIQIHNPEWETGMASSLKAGLQSLPADADAVMFLLADQPLLTPALINGLIDLYRQDGRSIVVPLCNGRRGNPVLFDWKRWGSELLRLQGDSGARLIIDKNPDSVSGLPVESSTTFCDVDTEGDYQKMLALFPQDPSAAGKG